MDRVLILGGSLAGLSLALALEHRGIPSTVLERTRPPVQGGAGLGVDRALLARVTGCDPRADAPGAAHLPVIRSGREATSWQLLHGWLRNRVRDGRHVEVQEGIVAERAGQDDGAAWVDAGGTRHSAPLLVGADGYRSLVRAAVSPEAPDAAYAGYVLWRGLAEEATMPAGTPWPADADGIGAIVEGYRLVAYPVPGAGSQLAPGRRAISFAWYDAGRNALLERLGCLSSDGRVLASLPPERFPPELVAELRRTADRVWPPPWRQAVHACLDRREVFATPITEYWPRRMAQGRLALVGDAAHAVSPMTGRGLVLGLLDAEALALALADCGLTPEALRRYEQVRLRPSQDLVRGSMDWGRTYLRGISRAAL